MEGATSKDLPPDALGEVEPAGPAPARGLSGEGAPHEGIYCP